MNASPTINNAADALADTLPNGGSVGAMRIREATLEDLTPVSGGPLGKLAKKKPVSDADHAPDGIPIKRSAPDSTGTGRE